MTEVTGVADPRDPRERGLLAAGRGRSRSELLFERAQNVLPGGASRNAILRHPHPLYVDTASGFNVTDVEGVSRVDFANNMTALIHGHADPTVLEAVQSQLSRGTAFNLGTEAEILFAEHLCSRNPGFERIRFVNSGTEAVMVAIRAARAFTGRSMIAKVEGAYHGSYDYAEVSQASTPQNWGALDEPSRVPVVKNTPAGVLDDVAIIPFNDTERSLAILDRYRGRIAAVLLDPLPHRVGLVRATPEFVDSIARWTREVGALLVFDEVISFRSAYGGAQEWYRDGPDLTALGKIIGGGFPIGAVAGRREVMKAFDPASRDYRFPLSGTFSANPVSMTAGLAAMRLFDRSAVDRLNRLTKRATSAIGAAIESERLPAAVVGAGSLFRIHFKSAPPASYRDAYPSSTEAKRQSSFTAYLLEHGVIPIETATFALSTPMAETEVEFLVRRVVEGLRFVAAG